MRIVLDTNVLVSALIKAGGSRKLLLKIADKKAQLILSGDILQEFLEVTEHPKIRRYVSEEEVIAFLRVLGSIAEITRIRSSFRVVREDPDDDAILWAAHDGKANFIVSGDKHLLSLEKFGSIKIACVSKMLEILENDND